MQKPSVYTTSAYDTFDIVCQVGANSNQSMAISIQENTAVALGVSSDGSFDMIMSDNGMVAYFNNMYALDVTSHDKATATISVIDDAISCISSQRASLGAYQNRLEHSISNLSNTSENLQTSESKIRDTNIADEMIRYSKNNIILQATKAMLAQANQSNDGVLSLLK